LTSAHWTPGIGDPTFAGWVTVVAYALAAILCFRTARQAQPRRWWQALGVLLTLMGINKQLDLQSLFTDVFRDLARAQGWYDQRGNYQAEFIVGMIVSGVLLAIFLGLAIGRKADDAVRLSIAAVCLLGTFVIVRAASFHHVDAMLGLTWLGVRFNTAMELGPLLMIMVAAQLEARHNDADNGSARDGHL
jgi:hypothetical protein